MTRDTHLVPLLWLLVVVGCLCVVLCQPGCTAPACEPLPCEQVPCEVPDYGPTGEAVRA